MVARRELVSDGVIPPSRTVLDVAQATNLRLAHENLGFLSAENGLMPRSQPRQALPGSHRAWDDVAAELPDLYRRLAVRTRVDTLPELPAGGDALPSEYLLRAASLLGILAHAYWWEDPDPPGRMPAALAVPWREISERLSRPAPHLSYVDLIVYNWKLIDSAQSDPFRVENMLLLVPTVNNDEERVFYLTQAEILARCTPIVDAAVSAQEAVCDDDADRLVDALGLIASCLDDAVRHSLPKINPAAYARRRVDPVVWAKTVAPFAVPFDKSVPGPSGTASPIVHVLDAFFDRPTYRSRIGREMAELHRWHPPHWQRFVGAVAQTSVPVYVSGHGSRRLRAAYDEALGRYTGESGFLGRHRLKVYGYLELAFKVGRTVTIGGFSGPFQNRVWNEVDNELASAADERRPPVLRADAAPAMSRLRPRGRTVTPSALALHNDDRHGYWLAVDGIVYDVTALRARHPGGVAILEAHAGTDATAVFKRIGHHRNHAVAALRDRYRVGVLDSSHRSELYRTWTNTLYLVAEMENALRVDYGSLPISGSVTPFNLRHRIQVHQRFLETYFDVLAEQVPDRLWRQTLSASSATHDAGWMRRRTNDIRLSAAYAVVCRGAADLSGDVAALAEVDSTAAEAIARRLDTQCRALERANTTFLAGAKRTVRIGVLLLERHASTDAVISNLCRLPDVAAQYCREAVELGSLRQGHAHRRVAPGET